MVAEYRQRLADEPDDPSALYNLGLGCLYSGRYDTAAEAFEAVTRLLPEDAVAYEKLAVALVRLGRRDEALDRAREAHRLDPDRASISRLVRVLEG
jgi:Flp pilus assembly protein TadD